MLQSDVPELRLPAGSFDLATAFETVYFWPGLEKCFGEVARVLKPGGCFLICNESDGKDETSAKFESIIDGMKCYTTEEIEAALKARRESWKPRPPKYRSGVLRLFDDSSLSAYSAWAFGISRGTDYLLTLPNVDANRIASAGHSRLARVSLWASA